MTNADLDARIALTGAVAHLMTARGSCTPETREALDVVLGYVQDHEEAERTTEWAVRWTADDGGYEYEDHPTEGAAAAVARSQHGEVVSREVSYSRYTAATS